MSNKARRRLERELQLLKPLYESGETAALLSALSAIEHAIGNGPEGFLPFWLLDGLRKAVFTQLSTEKTANNNRLHASIEESEHFERYLAVWYLERWEAFGRKRDVWPRAEAVSKQDLGVHVNAENIRKSVAKIDAMIRNGAKSSFAAAAMYETRSLMARRNVAMPEIRSSAAAPRKRLRRHPSHRRGH